MSNVNHVIDPGVPVASHMIDLRPVVDLDPDIVSMNPVLAEDDPQVMTDLDPLLNVVDLALICADKVI